MSISATRSEWARTEPDDIALVATMLMWASEFGLISLYSDPEQEGAFYWAPVQQDAPECSQPHPPRWLMGLCSRARLSRRRVLDLLG